MPAYPGARIAEPGPGWSREPDARGKFTGDVHLCHTPEGLQQRCVHGRMEHLPEAETKGQGDHLTAWIKDHSHPGVVLFCLGLPGGDSAWLGSTNAEIPQGILSFSAESGPNHHRLKRHVWSNSDILNSRVRARGREGCPCLRTIQLPYFLVVVLHSHRCLEVRTQPSVAGP